MSNIKKSIIYVLTIMTVLSFSLFFGCNSSSQPNNEPDETIIETQININIGETYTIEYDMGAKLSDVVWTVSDSSVVRLYNNNIIGIKSGSTEIYAITCSGKKFVWTVNVLGKVVENTEILYDNVSIDKTINLRVGTDFILKFDEHYKDVNKQFYSNDESVATINSDGKISAISVGCTIVNVVATINGATIVDSLNIIVNDGLSMITLDKQEVRLTVDAEISFNINEIKVSGNVLNDYDFADIAVSSDNSLVATVIADAGMYKIKGISGGQTIIRVKYAGEQNCYPEGYIVVKVDSHKDSVDIAIEDLTSDTNYVQLKYLSLFDTKLGMYYSDAGLQVINSLENTDKYGVLFSPRLIEAAVSQGYSMIELKMSRDYGSDPWVYIDGRNGFNEGNSKQIYRGNLEFANKGGTTIKVRLSDCFTSDGEYKLYFNFAKNQWASYMLINSIKFIEEENIEEATNYAASENIYMFDGSVYYLDGLGVQVRGEIQIDSNVLSKAVEQGYKKIILVLGLDNANIDPWVNVDGKDHRGGTNAKNFYAGNLSLISAGGTTIEVALSECLINEDYKLYLNQYGSDYFIINSMMFSKNDTTEEEPEENEIVIEEEANYATSENISMFNGSVYYLDGLGVQVRGEVEIDSNVLSKAVEQGYKKIILVLGLDNANIDPWVNVDGKDHRGETNAENFFAGNLGLISSGGTTIEVALAECLINEDYKLYLNQYGNDYFIINSIMFSKNDTTEEEPEENEIVIEEANYASSENIAIFNGSVYYLDGLGVQVRGEVEIDSSVLSIAVEQGYKKIILVLGLDNANIDPWVNVDGKDQRGGSNAKNIFAGNLGLISSGGTTVEVALSDCLIGEDYKLYLNQYGSDYFIISSMMFSKNDTTEEEPEESEIVIEEETNYATSENISMFNGNVYYLDGLGVQGRGEVKFDSNILETAVEQGYIKVVIVLGLDNTNVNPWVNVDGKDHRGGTDAENFFAGNLGVISSGGTTVEISLAKCLINGEYKLYFNTWSDYYIINSVMFSKA